MSRQQVVFTEEDAKQKDCPFGDKCSASACLGWRWSHAKHTTAFHELVLEKAKADDKKNWGKVHQRLMAEGKHLEFEHTEGYCGVGGNPVEN